MAANFAQVVGVRGDKADVLMPWTLEGHAEAKAVYDSVLDAKGVVTSKAKKGTKAKSLKYDYVELLDTQRGLLRKRSC